MIELDTNVIRQLNAFPVLKVCFIMIRRQVEEVILTISQVTVDHIVLHLHLCADTLSSVTVFASDLMSLFKSQEDHHE